MTLAPDRPDATSQSAEESLRGFRRPTLLFLVTEDWYFVSHRLPLARAAVEAGYRVVVATRVRQHERHITSAGCEVIPIQLRREGRSPIGELRAIIELVRLYRRVRPEIVHHVALKPVLYGSIAARCAGRPKVINAIAGLGYAFTGNSLEARLLRPLVSAAYKLLIAPRGGVVLVQNPDDRDLLLSRRLAPAEAIALIRGSGVDLAQFRVTPEPSGTPVVMLPARMLRDKGVEDFVESARILQHRGIAVRCVLAGGEDPANPAAIPLTQLRQWNAEGIVEWWGHQEDMPLALSQASVVCLPSYREGLPKALLEGAAAGRPLVATDVPGCREVVKSGENGLLVPVADPVKLADAIELLLGHPDERSAMGRRAREVAELEFSVTRVVEQTLALYQQVLS